MKFIQLETTNETSIKNAVTESETILGEKGLDVLINNAGIQRFAPDGIASMYSYFQRYIPSAY